MPLKRRRRSRNRAEGQPPANLRLVKAQPDKQQYEQSVKPVQSDMTDKTVQPVKAVQSAKPVQTAKAVQPVHSPAPTLLEEALYLLRKILVIAVLLALCGIFLFGAARNTDLGMTPAVKSGDLIFYFRLDKQYTASDVAALEIEGSFQTRRVIAVGGDTVDITEDGLLVNGYIQQEADVTGDTLAYTEGITFPVTLTENQVFLLGDNREHASDSRLYGAVDISDTLGKVVLILRRDP